MNRKTKTSFKNVSFITIKHLIITVITVSLFAACEKENETLISKNNADESHNMGQDCLICHVQGGDGEGWFRVAGTLYNNSQTSTYPNGNVKLTTEPNGSGALVKTIEIDSKGNFYTTETVDFGTGLYVGVFGTSGEQKFMTSKISTGACNSCHGTTTEKIWIE